MAPQNASFVRLDIKGKVFVFKLVFRDIFVFSFSTAKIQLCSYKKFYKHTTVQSDCLISNFVLTDNSIEEREKFFLRLFHGFVDPLDFV